LQYFAYETTFNFLSFRVLVADLDEVILKGVSKKISNVTAFWAFKGLEKLKLLGIFGDHEITSVGKKHLQSLLPESRGCVLYVT